MEKITKLDTFKVERICGKCGIGTMYSYSIGSVTNYGEHQHRCNHCDHIQSYDKIYPYLDYKKAK